MNDAFTVRLERVFHGPLDLLLHLVREQEVCLLYTSDAADD